MRQVRAGLVDRERSLACRQAWMKKRPKIFNAERAEEARRDRREEKAPEFNTEGTEVAQRALRRALGCAPTIARFSGFAAVISLLQRRGPGGWVGVLSRGGGRGFQ